MRKITALLPLLILVLLSGCWDQGDISELVIVDMIGIDKDKTTDEFILYFQVVNPTSFATQDRRVESSPVYTYVSRHKSLKAAVDKASLQVPRHMFFAKTKILLLSNELEVADMIEVFNFLDRNSETRAPIQTAVSLQPLSETMFRLTKINFIPGQWLSDNFEASQKHYTATHTKYRIRDNVEKYYRDGNLLFPAVIFLDQEAENMEFLNEVDTSSGHAQFVGGIAYQKKADPVSLSNEEMALYHLLTNQLNQMPITIMEDEKDAHFLDINRCETNHKTTKKYPFAFSFDIKCNADFLNSKVSKSITINTIDNIQNSANETLEEKLKELTEKLQEDELDLLGLFARYPSMNTEEKRASFKNATISYDVTIKIDDVGNIINPYSD
ncbi:Ger(x)C family spore germination protein [Alkalihalobacillus sp. CinArs1]|uniref:Ger(x)C family spore germination protein n=1 Tax=Alkalihalobacillus sp. CinArs1 TaxID=2995314 RepID=UPI0022DDAFCD|nr:Ger(x)C family spore germination C-terminal domain-containing protein [Alkalihalobacillus sp. CinArs1]